MSNESDYPYATYTPGHGPQVNTGEVRDLRTNAIEAMEMQAYEGRESLASILREQGSQYNGRRQLYEALGYEKDPQWEHYYAKYDRGGIATAIVDKPVKDCWGDTPIIHDKVDEDNDQSTAFEEAVENFFEGEGIRGSPLEMLETLDRMARLGEFALLFYGFNDEAVSSGDADDLKNPVATESLNGLDDLSYLGVYHQGRVGDENTDGIFLDDDVTSQRFQRPDHYKVDLDDEDRVGIEIHHSRIEHVAETPTDDPLYGRPILRAVYNRLDDLEKLLGGSAEMFWRGAYPGLVITPPDGAQFEAGSGAYSAPGTDVNDDPVGESQASQLDREWRHGLKRVFALQGNVEMMTPSVADPSNHIESQFLEISAALDIPQSILMGNETGERATQEDRRMYHEYLSRRRVRHCEDHILRPVIDRLIAYGILPEPTGDGYNVEWPPLDEPTESERAKTAKTKADALNTATAGMPDTAASIEEIREEIMGWSPEIGSEVEMGEASSGANAGGQPLPEDAGYLARDEDRATDDGEGGERDPTDDPVWGTNPSGPVITNEGDDGERTNETRYQQGDAVETPDGLGVIAETYQRDVSYDGTDYDGSNKSPLYEVVLEGTDPHFGFYKGSDLKKTTIDTGIESPAEDLAAERMNVAGEYDDDGRVRTNDIGFDSWPDSWEKSKKPARLIALDAWSSMGGTWTGCFAEIGSKRICSAFKDEMYGTTHWRGGFAD